MAELNFQHAWKKQTFFANEFLRDSTQFYLAPSALAAAADRLTALGAATAYTTTKTIPANTLAVGDVIEVHAGVLAVAQNASDTQLTQLRYTNASGTIIAATAATSLVANAAYTLYARGIVQAVGASGVIAWTSVASTNVGGTMAVAGATQLAPTDTTAAVVICVVGTQSANSAGNQADLRILDLRLNRAAGVGPDATVVVGNVNSLGFPGWKMNTAGERVRRLCQIADVNTAAPVFARVIWTSGSSTAADTITWKVAVKVQSAGSALSATVSDTLSLADTATASAYDYQVTVADDFAAGVIDNMDTFMLEVEMDAKAGGLTEDIYFLGVELLYVPVVVADLGQALASVPSGWPGT